MPKAARPRSAVLLEVDLGDTAIIVREFADGVFTIDCPTPDDGPLVLTTDAMQRIIGSFDQLGKAKGWL